MKPVGELMTRDLITLKETQNLAVADELLRLNRIRHLPVVRDGKLVGLITNRDLLKTAALAEKLPRLPRTRPLPVFRDGKLVGLITHRDLLKAAALKSPDPRKNP